MARVINIDIPDQSGRRAVVTGASDGIGAVIARRLAAAGAEVVLPVRNLDKGGRAAARIREAVPGASVEVHPLDLSSLASIATRRESAGDPPGQHRGTQRHAVPRVHR